MRAQRAMLKRCDGSLPRMRWPFQCPALLYTHGFTDKLHPHRVRGAHIKCWSGERTRRAEMFRARATR